MASTRVRTACSMARWTSSSSTTSAAVTRASARWPATRSALAGSAIHAASRSATRAARTRSVMISGVRNVDWTNSPSVSPNWSLRSGMTAVCGIGMPRGWRNRAVTANQSARAPTIDASSMART